MGTSEEQERCHQHGQLPQTLSPLEKVKSIKATGGTEVPALPSSSLGAGDLRSLLPKTTLELWPASSSSSSEVLDWHLAQVTG